METIKEFFKTKTGIQIYSFLKTYITVFIAIMLADTTKWGDIDYVLNALFISLVAVIRNIYKLLTE